MKEKEKLIEELKQFPMLAQITDADMEDLLLLLKREDFPEGSRITNSLRPAVGLRSSVLQQQRKDIPRKMER